MRSYFSPLRPFGSRSLTPFGSRFTSCEVVIARHLHSFLLARRCWQWVLPYIVTKSGPPYWDPQTWRFRLLNNQKLLTTPTQVLPWSTFLLKDLVNVVEGFYCDWIYTRNCHTSIIQIFSFDHPIPNKYHPWFAMAFNIINIQVATWSNHQKVRITAILSASSSEPIFSPRDFAHSLHHLFISQVLRLATSLDPWGVVLHFLSLLGDPYASM